MLPVFIFPKKEKVIDKIIDSEPELGILSVPFYIKCVYVQNQNIVYICWYKLNHTKYFSVILYSLLCLWDQSLEIYVAGISWWIREFIPFDENPGAEKQYLGIQKVILLQKTSKSKGTVTNIAIITIKQQTYEPQC